MAGDCADAEAETRQLPEEVVVGVGNPSPAIQGIAALELRSASEQRFPMRQAKRIRIREKSVFVKFGQWKVCDYSWPEDEERSVVFEQNRQLLNQRGVNVINASVDVMNVGPFLRSHGIGANEVVLAVIHGMCSRTGAGGREYRHTQRELGIQPGSGPITVAFAALTAALPQATVVVSATGRDKTRIVAEARVRSTATRPVLCREVKFPKVAPGGIEYRPEANGDDGRHFIHDPVPVALVAVGPSHRQIGTWAPSDLRWADTVFGLEEMDMGSLVAHAAGTGGVLLFCGEFTCTHSVHMANYCAERGLVPRRPLGHKLEEERMQWNGPSGVHYYTYEDAVEHAEEALVKKGKSTQHVGMHAANIWVNKAPGIQWTNFRPGDVCP